MPGRDWRLLKAQCWQESRFKINAVSSASAKGICQFMNATWNDVSKQTGFIGSPFDPDLNIMFSAYYMSKKLREFQDVDTFIERDKHAMAAYNAGGGNIMKARRICGTPQKWEQTKQCLPKVTGKHHKETWGYVDAIYKFYTLLIGID
jgi:membrane-bound lytic murein transglycosylase F